MTTLVSVSSSLTSSTDEQFPNIHGINSKTPMLFLSYTGFTVMAYVNYIRLKKATYLLRCTDKSILDIALEIGYDSHEGFIKSFKKNYEMSPSEYRNKNKNQIMLERKKYYA